MVYEKVMSIMGERRDRVNRIKNARGKGDVILNKKSELIGNVACEQRLGRDKELAMCISGERTL